MELQRVEWKEASESPLTRFLALPSVAVIVTGPFSCVCFAKDAALEKDEANRLFLCEMKQSDYITGKCKEKVLEAAKQAAAIPGVEQIVLYQCCTDYLTHTGYEVYLRQYFASKRTLRIYTFQRGSASLNYSRKKEIAEQVKKDAEMIAHGRAEGARSESCSQGVVGPVFLEISEKEEHSVGFQKAPKNAEKRSAFGKDSENMWQSQKMRTASEKTESGHERRIADYASVCAAFRDTDALVCIFSPGSCTGALYAAGLKSGENIYMSRLTDTELIIGCGSAFAKEASCRADKLGTKKIILVGTPVTRLLYPDFKETAEILRSQGFCVELSDTSGYETVEA